MLNVLERIEQRLAALGLTAAAASQAAGLGKDAIRNMQRARAADSRQGVSTHTLTALAPVLQTTAAWLIDGTGPNAPSMVRVIGRVGADPSGAVMLTTAHDSWDLAPLAPGGQPEDSALEVTGHSMPWLARDGSLIYFRFQRTPPTPDMLGFPVVVETEDGRILVKRLLRGSAPGLYDLESERGETISDVRVVWAAEITAIIPPREARRIIVRFGSAA
jgi:SOS-response transcriptional repressor LexA